MKGGLSLKVGLLLLSIPLVIFWGMNVGSFDYSLLEVWNSLVAPEGIQAVVVRDLRLPRVLLAMGSGALLTIGGFLMQAIVRNPLADPYIMGLSAGAGFGANLRILGIIALGSISVLPAYAFMGALLSLLLLFGLSFRALARDPGRVIIAGIAVSSFFVALTSFLIYTTEDAEDLRAVLYWSFGSFSYANWESVGITGSLLLVFWAFAIGMAPQLDVLALGDRQANSLGMSTGRMKLILLIATSLCIGGSIAFTGPIGFVGLMVPHFSRSVNGGLHRPNLIVGPLLGAIFLPICDIVSQLLYPPVGLPVGILTAMLGVPFFLYLLFFSRHRI